MKYVIFLLTNWIFHFPHVSGIVRKNVTFFKYLKHLFYVSENVILIQLLLNISKNRASIEVVHEKCNKGEM